MEMIGHQAIPQNGHGHLDAGVRYRLEECLIIAVFVKHSTSPISSIEDVVAKPANRGSCDARHHEELLDTARRWAHDKRFRIGAQILRGLLDGASAGAAFADVAESVIAELLPRIAAEHARSHGGVAGGEVSVLALGAPLPIVKGVASKVVPSNEA